MATFSGGFGVPGAGSIAETTEVQFLWGGDANKTSLKKNGVIRGESRDAGNSPTTVLRPGLLLGLETSTTEYSEFDGDAADGSENVAGILAHELRAQDFDANDADRVAAVCVGGPVKATHLLIQGDAFVGHVDEFLARQQMARSFVFDDDPLGALAGGLTRFGGTVTGTTDTLTDSQTGSTLFYSNAASVTVTLPTCKPGLEFMLVRTGDEEFIVTAGSAIMIGDNDTTVTTVTYTTASQHLGAYVHAKAVYEGTTAKWLVQTNDTLARAFA